MIKYQKTKYLSRKKILYWNKFLTTFKRDNPLYDKDELLRKKAKKHIDKLQRTIIHPKFFYRFSKEELYRQGGDQTTEKAVRAGLLWLKRHQAKDGSWHKEKMLQMCAQKRHNCQDVYSPAISKKAIAYNLSRYSWVTPALTGISLLSFLGAGYTHQTVAFSETVGKGLQYLQSIQNSEGFFGSKRGKYMYHQALATYAMAEAYALSGDVALKNSAQKGVKALVLSQNPLLAWGDTARSGINNTAISSWVHMALMIAKEAGLKVPGGSSLNFLRWVERSTNDKNGMVEYQWKKPAVPLKYAENAFPITTAMTAATITCRLFIKESKSSDRIKKGIKLLSLPIWKHGRKSYIDFHYWYYGTMAMFQLGGPHWNNWNRHIKRALLKNQNKYGCKNGSWDPVGKWGVAGGRIYSTAINILSLEVYYRYKRKK